MLPSEQRDPNGVCQERAKAEQERKKASNKVANGTASGRSGSRSLASEAKEKSKMDDEADEEEATGGSVFQLYIFHAYVLGDVV